MMELASISPFEEPQDDEEKTIVLEDDIQDAGIVLDVSTDDPMLGSDRRSGSARYSIRKKTWKTELDERCPRWRFGVYVGVVGLVCTIIFLFMVYVFDNSSRQRATIDALPNEATFTQTEFSYSYDYFACADDCWDCSEWLADECGADCSANVAFDIDWFCLGCDLWYNSYEYVPCYSFSYSFWWSYSFALEDSYSYSYSYSYWDSYTHEDPG